MRILLNILDIYDNKIIIKEEIEKYLTMCLYQNYDDDISIDKIIENLFPLDSKFFGFSEIYSSIIYKKNLYQVFENLLQCHNNKESSEDSDE